ncbi:VOC family protein [Cellulomonas sp. zg-ZUI222]|uniref:VOC family protein n=1 Tax=Cellulomonas wangleii TaxID=2816956 RepID=A0ABX8D5N6_9CELL|nr:VOC family protein [Cellulomonas wangleii]MBO0919504.1 VOC family protein [Cellulomonas wangleii]MBO0924356.1 VOC family protein [Cellulomonas wangleii]QVI62358.1 VOC family protein [Cellulomonas wangleii]
MDARVNLVTLAVQDVARSRRFYVDGLGWPVLGEVPGEVVFVRLSPTLVLSLWRAASFVDEVGPAGTPPGEAPFVLAHNVPTPAAVDAAVADVIAAGGALVHAPVRREWGGYSAYVADPDGFRWELAYNPGPMGLSLMAADGLA